MPAPVVAGSSFRGGLRSELLGTYARQYEGIRATLQGAMTMDIPSDKRAEFYFYWESAPHFARWAYGEPMSEESFKGIQFEVPNHRWAKAISWQADDLADDVTRSLLTHARGLGQSAAMIDERVFFQILLGSTDNDLLPSVPNAPDGSSLFAGTSSTRFGATDGNIVTATTTGVTEDEIRTNYWTARQRFRLFQDTKGQPLLNDGVVDGPALVIFNAANESTFAAAFQRSTFPVPSEASAGAGVSDEIAASGKTPTLRPTQRITDDDWFVFLTSVQLKPIFSQAREALREVIANMQNSDLARQFDEESIRFKMRKGYGVALPYGAIQINEPS